MRILQRLCSFMGVYANPLDLQVQVVATRPGSTSAPSWTRQQIVLHQIGDAPAPRFVGVAANVDAMDERHSSGRDIGHVDVDVEDEIRHFLDHNPRDGIGAELFAVTELAAAAGPDLWTSLNFSRGVSGYGDELVPATVPEFFLYEGRDQAKDGP